LRKHLSGSRKADKMDLLSKLQEKWRSKKVGQHSKRIFNQCADELAALRPVIEKLVSAGESTAQHLDSLSYDDVNEPHNCKGCQDAVKALRAALASWKVENDPKKNFLHVPLDDA
jgi:hypothetical protein